jgi:hypothetical protein
MKINHFSQSELEAAIYKTLNHGDEIAIAEKTGMGYSIVSQYLSPDNDRVSPIFRSAQMFAAMIEIDEENGRAALDVFNYFVRRAQKGDGSLCVEHTRAKSFKEGCEAQLAEASGESLDVCIKEYEERIAADAEHLEALRGKKRREIRGQIFETVTNGNGRRKVA